MDRLIYTAMTGANAATQLQNVLANNLANASTNGFRAEMNTYRSVPVQGPGLPTRTMTVEATSGYDSSTGSVQRTDRNLDAMAKGNAWFAVQALDGTEAYTRNGSFEVSPTGNLTNSAGLPMLTTDGAPVNIPPNADLTLGEDGTITAAPTTRSCAGPTACSGPSPGIRPIPTRMPACRPAWSKAPTSTR